MYKCVVDGKTSYQSSPCVIEDSERSISDKTFTNGLNTESVRTQIMIDQAIKEEQARIAQEQEEKNAKYRQEQAQIEQMKLMNKNLKSMKGTLRRMEVDQNNDRIQSLFKR